MAGKPGGRAAHKPRHNVGAGPAPGCGRRCGRLAPGTPLRDGLERILRGRTGALIVLGYDDSVRIDLRRRLLAGRPLRARPGCGSCRRWTARWCCPPTAAASCGPTCSWCPTRPSRPTSPAPGTGLPNAPRSRPAIPLISVSHSMSIVTVYVAGERHVCPTRRPSCRGPTRPSPPSSATSPGSTRCSRQLSTAEIEDFVTLRDVMTVVQRLEMVRRISLEIDGRRRRTRHRRPPAQAAARGAGRRQRHRPRVDRARLPRQSRPADARAGQRDARGARHTVGHRTSRLHRAGKGFRLSVDGGGAGLGDELARLPRDGRHPAAAVRPRRPAGALVRIAAGSAGGERRRSAVGRGHRRRCGHATSAKGLSHWPSRRSPTAWCERRASVALRAGPRRRRLPGRGRRRGRRGGSARMNGTGAERRLPS